MKAIEFYSAFEKGFAPLADRGGLIKFKGKTPKWKLSTSVGDLHFAFAVNPKSVGLLPIFLEDFRLQLWWLTGKGANRKKQKVSIFQYTTVTENQGYAALERQACTKFFTLPGKEYLHATNIYWQDPSWLPRPNIEEFCSYFDEEDARQWGAWYGSIAATFGSRFEVAPESWSDWYSRVSAHIGNERKHEA